MGVGRLLEDLGIDLDKALYNLTQKQLANLLLELAKNVGKKDLIELIIRDFGPDNLFKVLEKKNRKLLFQILNEPDHEKDLRRPVANWLKNNGYMYDFEVPLPEGKRKRYIDVVGYKRGGFLSSDRILAFELKIATTRQAIDSAFSQAKDYLDCSDGVYVVVSPYMYLKYHDVLKDKVEKYDGTIGLIVADKSRVLAKIYEPEETRINKQKYRQIKEHFLK